MADTLLPAEPETEALQLRWEGDVPIVNRHPVIGWAYVSGGMAHPLTAANITDVRAVLFPSGEVTDRQLRATFVAFDLWLDEIRSLGPGREIEPHRSGGGVVVETPEDDPELTDGGEPDDSVPEELVARSIDDLDLSTRAKNALKADGISVVHDFGSVTMKYVRDIRGVPSNALPVIEAAMATEGVAWKGGSVPRGPIEHKSDNDDLL